MTLLGHSIATLSFTLGLMFLTNVSYARPASRRDTETWKLSSVDVVVSNGGEFTTGNDNDTVSANSLANQSVIEQNDQRVESCFEPPVDDLHRSLSEVETLRPAVSKEFATWPYRNTEELTSIIRSDENPHPDVSSNFTCPLEVADLITAEDNEMALCPWTYAINTDSERFPRTIAEAKCRCQGCIDPDTGGVASDGRYCSAVHYNFWVLKRTGCRNGVYTYDYVREAIPVACACIRPRVIRQE
ncbi:uncharacterized protein [Ptychodera flava]|uniref:uncharacterized protein n=1 Tax=Ptychodera flava TaxID=63121 RepID=UPI00396A651F